MPPRKAGKAAAKAVTYDYSELEEGMRVQAESDGVYYAAEVVTVSTSKGRSKAPVKIAFKGYDSSCNEWVSGDRLRSKAVKKVTPEAEKRPPLEFNFGYWKIRGLGSIFRMIFEYKGVKYTDNQYASGDDWFKNGKPGILEKTPLANLPYVECGSDVVCQTNACLAFVGQKLRLNGGGYKARLLNDQLLCEIYDVRNTIIDLSYPFRTVCRDQAEHTDKSKKHVTGTPFSKFEAILEKSGTDYFCGKQPCTSDFHIWEMLDQHKLLAEKHSCGDIFASIPKCKAFYDRFRALPTLQKYFESADYKLPVNNPIANPHFQ
jgi:glutathione S-transferase